ncbi:YjjG family noncanonical pyrimidine nucleotidase [Anaerovorax odorimutans]|uniref:YjjG family noncanonical pyrimidine nucleotidase n=1 Tax=Anaerovorax odorimutans TaxID=109327 RepID=A0ABT1RRF9_9FIRM|nr:YjjG family noncanonical pyrimidine nucleotidase [Anaerovorax odorimutans]MCQ4637741.1 YjjG family noncanonical pyrimidine nucleotidase [Anaerovorax odorimutans]
MSEITTLLWDVDGTLLDFETSEEICMNQCLENYGISIDRQQFEWYKACNRSYWERFERKEIPKERVYIGRFEDFFAYLEIDGIDYRSFNDDYQKELGNSAVLQDYALELCQRLSAKYRQYVVTNGSSIAQNGKLRDSQLYGLMDGIFISEEMGTEKPSKEFFDLCAQKIPDYDPQATMIIGDSLTSDMAGGGNAGIRCCWYNPAGLPVPEGMKIDYVISSLRELETILLVEEGA